MCLIIHQTLMRESPDSRLPDVVGPTVVLAAWTTAAFFRGRGSRRATVVITGVIACVLWLVTLGSATILGNTGERMIATAIPAGLTAARERFNTVSQLMHLRPIDYYAPGDDTGVRALTRYVLECTG